MAKKNNTEKTTGNLESRITLLEKRVTKLETQLEKHFNRRKREYTEEEMWKNLEDWIRIITPVAEEEGILLGNVFEITQRSKVRRCKRKIEDKK